jgi:hypothetical protein
MEMRKESELGGLGEEATEVMNEEDTMLTEDTASKEGIKDEDLQELAKRLKIYVDCSMKDRPRNKRNVADFRFMRRPR